MGKHHLNKGLDHPLLKGKPDDFVNASDEMKFNSTGCKSRDLWISK